MTSLFSHTIFIVARNTFKETVRNKILYVILAFAVAYMAFTVFLGTLSLGEDLHVIRSLGLAGIYVFGLVITIFLGSSLLYQEVERGTLHFTLAKPVSRAHLVLGKFFGLLASVALALAGMMVVYLCAVMLRGGGLDMLAVLAVFYELLEMALLIALTILFSTFAMPLLSALYAVLVIYIGHSLELLTSAVAQSAVALRLVVRSIYYILPNLGKFDIRSAVVYQTHIPVTQTLTVIAYALVYVTLLLYLAIIVFEKHEL